MKHFSKQLSWLLAFALIFTSIVSIGIPVYASDTITIGESTDEVILAGTNVELYDRGGDLYITYYESVDSNTVLYEDESYWGDELTIGSDEIANKPYAWHVTFVEIVQDNSGTARHPEYYFKAYPDTSLENVPVGTTMAFPEGTTLNTTGDAINVSVYVEDATLTDYNEESSSFTLPSASVLRSYVSEAQFDLALETADYNLPDLTKLYYTVELTDKSTASYSLKLTLVPTVEVTFDENTGIPDLTGTKMYATPYATIDGTKLPEVSLDGFAFYGWKIAGSDDYVYIENETDTSSLKQRVSGICQLKAMFQENEPTFSLDLENKKVTDLLPGRTYAYLPNEYYTWDIISIVADHNGEFSYEELDSSESQAKLRLNSANADKFAHSDYVSLRHGTPNNPVVEYTATTARVTNDFTGCEFAIRATSDDSALSWGTSSTFSGLTPETEYKIYVKHPADNNGFESVQAESLAFTTLAAKAVSNEEPNGVTIEDIPDQIHTNSAIEPTLLIKDGDQTLIEDTDYTVAYTDNISVGTATATVTFINDYSGSMTKTFEITYTAATTPVISPNGGTFSGSQTITLTTETPDAIIYYTIDGTDPTTESTLYSQPFIISSSTTVKAIAVKGGMLNSDIVSASFTKRSSSSSSSSYTPPTNNIITVSAVKSELFKKAEDIKVEADVTSAFGQSVEVKITDSTEAQNEVFSLAGADDKVYPFDISLYSKESNNKVQPKDGYSVKITIPVPEKLLEDREQIKVVYGKDGKLETLKSELIEKDGKWYIIFEATHFSPYALVVSAEPEPSVSWTNPFSDVKEGDWYYSAIEYVAQNGLMLGTGSNTFSPELTTNRGMIATILYRLSGSSETLQSTFKDVIPGAYYANEVAWAQEKGIIAGYGNGIFGPEDSITREQMAAILWRYAGSPVAADSKGLAGFIDTDEISLYAKDALAWIYEKGIILGKGNGILDPKGKATRAEVAQIIFNFTQKADLTE